MTQTVGNIYDKYGTKNPVARLLMRRFLGTVTEFAAGVSAQSVLEIGCGEGRLAQHLYERLHSTRFAACDLSLQRLDANCSRNIEFREASAYALPYATGEFDLVVCCEVLEHLKEPARAVAEIARVSKRWAVISTPNEPLFRGLNLLRGAHLARLGNTPGHVQQFSPRSLEQLVSARFSTQKLRCPVPWVVILAERIPRI